MVSVTKSRIFAMLYCFFNHGWLRLTGCHQLVLFAQVMIVMTVRDYRSFRSRGMPGWVDTLAVFLVTLPLLWIPLWFLCYVWPRSTPLPKGVWQVIFIFFIFSSSDSVLLYVHGDHKDH